jgi:nucleoside-diphosphate-sugar epimerase
MLMFSRQGGFSADKAKSLLGYHPKVDIKEGMRRSEAWLREVGEID